MDERDIIAYNVAFLRKSQGLSQLELAEKLQYSNKNISKWEKGETTPSIFTLKRLAETFGVTVDKLVSKTLTEEDVLALSADSDDTEKVTTDNQTKSEQIKVILGLPLSIKILYLLMTEAILLVGGVIAVIVLGLLDVTSFNKWLILLYVLPAMALAVFVFVICIKKRVDVISLSIFGWLLTLCFYLSFIDVKNIRLIFLLMFAIQLLIVCIMLIINLSIKRRQKNKLLKNQINEKTDL